MKKAFAILLLVAGCTGEPTPNDDPPTIALLSPEGDVRVHENLAVAGEATGALDKVEVRLDAGEPQKATGLEDWFYLLDVSGLPDGSHTVAAIATDDKDRTAESIAVSFTSVANQPPNTSIWSGLVRNNDQEPLPGSTVSVFGTALSTLADANARYAMVGLPSTSEALLVGHSPGYEDTYMVRFTPGGDASLDIPMFDSPVLDFIANEYGVTRQPGLGTLIGFVFEAFPANGGYAGAVVSLGASTGDGPYYTTITGDFDPNLVETTGSGVYLFFNVSTGPVMVTASDGAAQFSLFGSEAGADSVTLLYGRAQ